MIKIVQPNENDNGYKYEFTVNGEKGTGYLTYDLMDNLEQRTLLLTTKTNIIKSKKVKRNFEALREQINLYKDKGAFFTAKGVVNKIYDKEFSIPNVSVAVHRFGPIPVCVLPQSFDLEFNGEKRKCQIGIYPYIKSSPSREVAPKIVFLQSMKIRLDVILKRYLEDVGENFFDIENHSDLPSAIKKAKASESILSESITTKLDAILSTTRGNPGKVFSEISDCKRELIKNYSDTLFKVRYAKYYAYFFINELYRSIGFGPKDFKSKFKELKNENNFDYDNRINEDMDLVLLRKSIKYYYTGKGKNILEENLANQATTLWVKRFIQFSTFVHYLSYQNGLNPHTAKIFLSNRFTKTTSQTLKVKLEELINGYFLNRVDLLAVRETSAGEFLNEMVKSRIWLSSATYTVIPGTKESDRTNFNWIAKEAIYSESLKNKLLFILNRDEDGSLIDSFKDYVLKLDDYLVPEARNIDYCKDGVVKKLNNKLHAKYNEETIVDDTFKKSLIKDIKALIELKVISIIEAWLNQFSEEASSIILDMNSKLKYPQRISEASKKVFSHKTDWSIDEKKKKFRSIWKEIRKRKLLVNDKEYTLVKTIGITSNTQYVQNLPDILRALIGTDDDIFILLNKCHKLRGDF